MRTVNAKFTNHKNPRARKDREDPNRVSANDPTPSTMTPCGNKNQVTGTDVTPHITKEKGDACTRKIHS